MTRSTDARTVVVTGNHVVDDGDAAAGPSHDGHRAPGATRCPDCTDGLGKPRPVEPGSFRDRLQHNRPAYFAWRIGVFVVGLLFVLLGIALTALPGPLTIPPVLLGLWVWSTEFDWARRLFATFRRKASDTWKHAKQHPVSSAVVTVGGLALAVVAFWAVGHFHLVEEAETALGIGS